MFILLAITFDKSSIRWRFWIISFMGNQRALWYSSKFYLELKWSVYLIFYILHICKSGKNTEVKKKEIKHFTEGGWLDSSSRNWSKIKKVKIRKVSSENIYIIYRRKREGLKTIEDFHPSKLSGVKLFGISIDKHLSSARCNNRSVRRLNKIHTFLSG